MVDVQLGNLIESSGTIQLGTSSVSPLAFRPSRCGTQPWVVHTRLYHRVRYQLQTAKLRATFTLRPKRDSDIVSTAVVQNALGNREARLWAKNVD